MIVDAHHHLWDPAAADYPWLTDEVAPIRRRFAPEDLAPLLVARGVDATVVVQARASLDETHELLATAAAVPWLAGVVGWADLTDPAIADVLAELRGEPLVGIRHQVHDEPDPAWLLRGDVGRGLRAVEQEGLVYDLLVRPRELPAAVEVARRFPGLRLVVDHLAKPPLRDGDTAAWVEGLSGLAALPNVCCKLSGLVTEAAWDSWGPGELVPYLRRALDWFGPERSLFGSDWPVCLLAASYDEVVDLALAVLEPGERAAVMGGTAARLYRLDD
ncbi:MAG: amidohydrolase family protein [Gaiellaceae bacterium]